MLKLCPSANDQPTGKTSAACPSASFSPPSPRPNQSICPSPGPISSRETSDPASFSTTSVTLSARLSRRIGLESRPCDLIEATTMAILAAIAAGSVWMVVAPLMGLDPGFWQLASLSMHDAMAPAFMGGLLGGAMAGLLLELFRFPWVHDV